MTGVCLLRVKNEHDEITRNNIKQYSYVCVCMCVQTKE